MKFRKVLAMLLALAMVVSLAACASQQAEEPAAEEATEEAAEEAAEEEAVADLGDYPNKPIQVIVPYAPGGGSDVLTRAMIEGATKRGVDIVAVNVEGAGGLVGTMQAFESDPDGYTLFVQCAHDLMGFSMSGNTDIELYLDCTTICDMVASFNLILVNKNSGFETIDDLVEYAKAHPGEVTWSCTGAQGMDYSNTKMSIEALGLEDCVSIVPYDSGAAGNTALLGNQVTVSTNTASDCAGSINSGDVIPLAVFAPERRPNMPDVPTAVECGINYDMYIARGFYAPPGLPENIRQYLEDLMREISEDEEFIERAASMGLETNFVPGPEAREIMIKDSVPLQAILDEELANQ